MPRIPIEKCEIGVECFESLSNGSNLHWNGSNPFEMVRMRFRKLPITFEWLEFAFENFESLSNGSNLHSNASNPFRMVQILFRNLRVPFERFNFCIRML